VVDATTGHVSRTGSAARPTPGRRSQPASRRRSDTSHTRGRGAARVLEHGSDEFRQYPLDIGERPIEERGDVGGTNQSRHRGIAIAAEYASDGSHGIVSAAT